MQVLIEINSLICLYFSGKELMGNELIVSEAGEGLAEELGPLLSNAVVESLNEA